MGFVSDESGHDVSLILEWLLELDLLFNFLKSCVVLHLDCLASFFKQVDHLLAVKDEINSGEINSLNLEFLLKIALEKKTSGVIVVLKLVSEHYVELMSVP